MNSTEKLLSPREVAAALGVSRATVNRMMRDGRLPSVKLGPQRNASVRIDPLDVAETLVGERQEGPLVSLVEVAARVGRDVEWALARVGELPAVTRDDGYYVRAAELRAWHRAAQAELERRDTP